jgi:uncharacterized cofD-like protein
MQEKKIVVIGGGTGTYQVLTGLKRYPVELTAIISMCDSGGSTGRLRRELGILPPGDLRQAILALSDLPFAQKTLEEVFDFRFENGESLKGHSVGNILLAALVQVTGSMDKAIAEISRILNVAGSVYPVTLDKTNLVAVLTDGTKIFGESKIDLRKTKLDQKIKKVYLFPKARVFKKAAEAIKKADLIVLGPGDLFTSITPTLLVEGLNEAISRSKGKLVYVVNLVTKKEETRDFQASDFVAEIEKYLGFASRKLDYVLVNKRLSEKGLVAKWYRRHGSRPVKNDLEGNGQFRVIEKDFVDVTTLFRHEPAKLAKTLVSLLY